MLVLIIDQDEKYLEETEMVIKKENTRVAVFQDAMAAVKYGYNHDVDAVYTEVVMPHISGCDVIKLLKQRHPELRGYFLTQSMNYLDIAKQHQIDGYYVKPFRGASHSENLLMEAVMAES